MSVRQLIPEHLADIPPGPGLARELADLEPSGSVLRDEIRAALVLPDERRRRNSAWAGVELRVQLSTLMGHDQYPAEVAGWGPVHAELSRDLAATLGAAQWRFVVTDKHGRPIHCGITRARPAATAARATECRAIVELQVPATALHTLAAEPDTLGGWATVVADLIRQLAADPAPQTGQ